MQVVHRFRLRDFGQNHEGAERQLRAWHQFVSSADWEGPEQLARTFVNLSESDGCTVFDIRGSTYFLRTRIDWNRRAIYVIDVLLHSDYRKRQTVVDPTGAVERPPGDAHSFQSLLQKFEPRPIRDEERLRQAAAVIDGLLASPELTPDEQDYLELLTLLIVDYETSSVPVQAVSGAEVLRYLIMEHRLSLAELIPMFGRKASAAAILKGENRLTLQQISRASRYFKVPGEIFFDTEDFQNDDG